MVAEIFRAILIMSAVGGILVGILLAAKPLTERVFGFKLQFYAWLSVLAVMLIPARFEWVIELPEKARQTALPLRTDYIIETTDGLYKISEPVGQVQTLETDFFFVCAVLWAIIAAFLILKAVVGNLVLKRSLMKQSLCIGNLKSAKIMECKTIGAPVLFGGIKSVVFVPEGMSDDSRMKYVLAHEGVHMKRRDLFVKWLAVLMRCIHWFNPLVYVAAGQLDEACEISCDMKAVEGFSYDERKEYIKTVLDFSQKENEFRNFVLAGLTNNGRCMKKRFSAVLEPVSAHCALYAVGAAGIVLLTFVTVCVSALTVGAKVAQREKPESVSVAEKITVEQPATEEQPDMEFVQAVTEQPLPEQPQEETAELEDTENTEKEDDISAKPEESILRTPVASGEFDSDGGDTRTICGIKPDERGCITLVIQSNTSEVVDVFLSDSQSGKEVHSFGLPVDKGATYVMEVLDPEKTYDIVLKGEMRNDWKIESDYVIY